MLDLVLLCIFSWIVIKKLKTIIGNETSEEKYQHVKRNFQVSNADEAFNHILPDVKEKISKIERLKDLNFTNFLKSAEKCFDLFIESINKKDTTIIADFCSEALISKLKSNFNRSDFDTYIEVIEIKTFNIVDVYQSEEGVFIEIQNTTLQNIKNQKKSDEMIVSERLTFKQNNTNQKLWILQNIV